MHLFAILLLLLHPVQYELQFFLLSITFKMSNQKATRGFLIGLHYLVMKLEIQP